MIILHAHQRSSLQATDRDCTNEIKSTLAAQTTLATPTTQPGQISLLAPVFLASQSLIIHIKFYPCELGACLACIRSLPESQPDAYGCRQLDGFARSLACDFSLLFYFFFSFPSACSMILFGPNLASSEHFGSVRFGSVRLCRANSVVVL